MRTFTATIVGLLLSLTLSPAFAEAGATGGPTASPPGASAYFVDLKDGATIGPTTTIHFGLHGMGVAPAGSDKANSGHHHLLIDTDLPPLDQPIPNDENHIHFGAGQTEVDLTLTPGPHTLQLLLGDKDHIPHSPPVMSPPIHVNVAASGAPSPPGAAAYFVDLKDGATIGPTTTIHFGLHGMGVAPAGSDKANSGHHHLLIDTDLPPLDQPIPNDENHMHFGAGQTEVDLTLTPGPHTLQLLLGDKNHVPHSPPVMSPRIHVDVAAAAPAPPPAATDAPSSAGGAGPVEQTPAKTSPPGAPPAATGAPSSARHTSPPGAKEYIVSPADGDYVPKTFTIRFGLVNMGLAPAGVEKANFGHHHLLIDAPLPALDQPIPNDENHLHFGAGQTEATITLTPGRHTLQLLLGDAQHVPHDPPVYSQPITVFVPTYWWTVPP